LTKPAKKSLPILLISDLHLEDERPDITRTLLKFLQEHAGNCQALYVLGDLFEAWIGDDDITPLSEEIAQALAEFHASGSEIFLLHGNRDFLIGEEYAKRCAANLIQEPTVLENQGIHFLLLHGDSLCTDDHDYMEFRSMVRNPDWQQDFLAKPLAERREFARQAREQSQSATASKPMEIMDVNQSAVAELIQQSGQTRIIHGHTHRPAVHQIQLAEPVAGETDATRLVLGDWHKKGWYAEVHQGEMSLHHFPLLAGRI
jgi:UDP-2,3-diacylglucosamine hydrolase